MDDNYIARYWFYTSRRYWKPKSTQDGNRTLFLKKQLNKLLQQKLPSKKMENLINLNSMLLTTEDAYNNLFQKRDLFVNKPSLKVH